MANRNILSKVTANLLGLDLSQGRDLGDGNYDFGEMPTDYSAFAFKGEGTTSNSGNPLTRPTTTPNPATNPLARPVVGGITQPPPGPTTQTYPFQPTPTNNQSQGFPSSVANNPYTPPPSLGSRTMPGGNTVSPITSGTTTPTDSGNIIGRPSPGAAVAKDGAIGQVAVNQVGNVLKSGAGVVNPVGRNTGTTNPVNNDPTAPANKPVPGVTPKIDQRGWLTLPDGTQLEHRHDPRIWGTTGEMVIGQYDPQTGEVRDNAPRDPRYWISTTTPPDESGNSYTVHRLRPEVLARLKGRVQIPQAGLGGYQEVKDPSKLEWDPEFGYLTTVDNIGPQDRENARRWGNFMMIAMGSVIGGAALSHSGLLGGSAGNPTPGGTTGGTAAGATGGTGATGAVGATGATGAATGATGAVNMGTINVVGRALPAAGGLSTGAVAGGAVGAGLTANALANPNTTTNQPNTTQNNTNQPGSTPPNPPANTPTGLEQVWNGVKYVWNGVKWVAQALGVVNALSGNRILPSGRDGPASGDDGTVNSLIRGALGVWDSNRNRQQYENEYREAADTADYNRQYRPDYLARLHEFMLNPERALNDPTYRAVRERGLTDLERRLNARGFNFSGNELGELTKYGQELDWKQIERERSALMEGSKLGDPTAAANILSRGASDSYRSRNNRSAGPGAALVNAGVQIAGRAISEWINALSSGKINWAEIPPDLQQSLRAEIPEDILIDAGVELPAGWGLDDIPDIYTDPDSGEVDDTEFWDWIWGDD